MRTFLTALMGLVVAAFASPPESEKAAQTGAEFGYVNQQLAVKTLLAQHLADHKH